MIQTLTQLRPPATMIIDDGTFVGNHAGEARGAILAEHGSNLDLYNSEF